MLHTLNTIIAMPLISHVETTLTHKKAKGSKKNRIGMCLPKKLKPIKRIGTNSNIFDIPVLLYHITLSSLNTVISYIKRLLYYTLYQVLCVIQS